MRGSCAASISSIFGLWGVLGDVVDGRGQTGAVTHGDQTLSGQQQQSAGLVGGIVGHGDGCAVRDVGKVIALARIDAERLIVDGADADEVGAVLLVEAVKVGGVLEVVGIDLAALGDKVGLDIVAELNDLRSMPCSARTSLATFRISAWGVGRRRPSGVVPASRWSQGWTRRQIPRRCFLGGAGAASVVGGGGAAGGELRGQGSGEALQK